MVAAAVVPRRWTTSGTTIPETAQDRISHVEFAAYFVALQPGGAERLFRQHHPTPNGLCSGCLARPIVYPCLAASIAELARRRTERVRRETVVGIEDWQ
jgi:hypothetical protein